MADDYLIYPKRPARLSKGQEAMRMIERRLNPKQHPSPMVRILESASIDRSKPPTLSIPRALKVQ